MTEIALARQALVRRGLWLTWLTFGYNSVEAVLSLGAAALAGSVALLGFGVDSAIELSASAIAIWRLYHDADEDRRESRELLALRLIGFSFVVLAGYLAYEAVGMLWRGEAPDESLIGIAIATVAVIVMPMLARAKKQVACGIGSGALNAEATQTMLCTYLSAILLAGLVLNATLGWWWADPLAALLMVPIIGKEGYDALRGKASCPCCSATPAGFE